MVVYKISLQSHQNSILKNEEKIVGEEYPNPPPHICSVGLFFFFHFKLGIWLYSFYLNFGFFFFFFSKKDIFLKKNYLLGS